MIEVKFYKLEEYVQLFSLANYERIGNSISEVMDEIEKLWKPVSIRSTDEPTVFAYLTTYWDPRPDDDSLDDCIYRHWVVGVSKSELMGCQFAVDNDLMFCKDAKDFMRLCNKESMLSEVEFFSKTTDIVELVARTKDETLVELNVDAFEFPKLKKLMEGLGYFQMSREAPMAI